MLVLLAFPPPLVREGEKRNLVTLSLQVNNNPLMKAYYHFRNYYESNTDMARALIEKNEIDADCHVNIMLKYRDEFKSLVSTLRSACQEV